MDAALYSVTHNGLSGNRAADLHGVPRSMLKDRLSGYVKHGTNPGPKPYLTVEEEAELTSHLLQAADIQWIRQDQARCKVHCRNLCSTEKGTERLCC